MIFNQFIELPGPALPRLRAVKGRGSMAACSATVASAEWQGAVAGHQKLRSRRRSRLSRAGRGLTLRSRRGPAAGHQARATGTVYIFCGSGLASHRWSRLTSNVRPRETRRAMLQQSQRLSAWTEQPRRGGPRGDCAPTTARGTVGLCGEIGRHEDRKLVIGTTLTQVLKAMTGNRRATSEHRAAWEAIVGSLGRIRLARLRTVKGRGGSIARRAIVASAQCRGAIAEHQKPRGPPRSRLWHAGRGLTLRSRRGPTALHLARAAPVVHDALRGQGAIPSVPPHLKR